MRAVLPAATSLTLALGWLALSRWHPTVTYHLGPPLVALAWPVLTRARARHQLDQRAAAVSAVAGTVLALLAVALAARLRSFPRP